MNNLNWENLRSAGKNISEKGVYIVMMGMVLAVLPLLSFIKIHIFESVLPYTHQLVKLCFYIGIPLFIVNMIFSPESDNWIGTIDDETKQILKDNPDLTVVLQERGLSTRMVPSGWGKVEKMYLIHGYRKDSYGLPAITHKKLSEETTFPSKKAMILFGIAVFLLAISFYGLRDWLFSLSKLTLPILRGSCVVLIISSFRPNFLRYCSVISSVCIIFYSGYSPNAGFQWELVSISAWLFVTAAIGVYWVAGYLEYAPEYLKYQKDWRGLYREKRGGKIT